jgi:hypothetical protein
MRRRAEFLGVVILLGTTLAAVAQEPPKPATAKPKPEVQKPEPAKPQASTPVPPPVSSGGTAAVVMDVSAIESLVGKSVRSSGGEDLGHIIDLLVTTSGQTRAVVIDFGGVLGVGARKVAVDWKALDFSGVVKDGTLRLALTRDQVRVAPEYKAGDPVVILEATRPADGQPAVVAQKQAPAGGKPADAGGASPPQGPAH